jgi:hypothetical protein
MNGPAVAGAFCGFDKVKGLISPLIEKYSTKHFTKLNLLARVTGAHRSFSTNRETRSAVTSLRSTSPQCLQKARRAASVLTNGEPSERLCATYEVTASASRTGCRQVRYPPLCEAPEFRSGHRHSQSQHYDDPGSLRFPATRFPCGVAR